MQFDQLVATIVFIGALVTGFEAVNGPPAYTFPLRSYWPEGSYFSIECQASPNFEKESVFFVKRGVYIHPDGNESYPAVANAREWRISNGTSLTGAFAKDTHYVLTATDETTTRMRLEITELHPTDSGQLGCVVLRDEDEAVLHREKFINVTVVGEPSHIELLIGNGSDLVNITEGHMIHASENSPVDLACRVYFPTRRPSISVIIVDPDLNIQTHNVTDQFTEHPIQNNLFIVKYGLLHSLFTVDLSGRKLETVGDVSASTGYAPHPEHNGKKIVCRASMNHVTLFAWAMLNITYKPKIECSENSLVVANGIEKHCRVYSNPMAEISWHEENTGEVAGYPIVYETPSRMNYTTAILRVLDTKNNFIIVAKNDLGEERALVNFTSNSESVRGPVWKVMTATACVILWWMF